jgi:hypothetical protein
MALARPSRANKERIARYQGFAPGLPQRGPSGLNATPTSEALLRRRGVAKNRCPHSSEILLWCINPPPPLRAGRRAPLAAASENYRMSLPAVWLAGSLE